MIQDMDHYTIANLHIKIVRLTEQNRELRQLVEILKNEIDNHYCEE